MYHLRMGYRWLSLALAATVVACGGGDEEGGGAGGADDPGPTCTDCTPAGDMTFRLPSPPGAVLWTTTTMDKVLREAAPPETDGDGLTLFAAKNEFEPFQIVVFPEADADVSLEMTAFDGPSGIDRIEIRKVGYVRISEPSDASSIPSGMIPDPLDPFSFGQSEPLSAGSN